MGTGARTLTEYESRYQCGYCGQWFVVTCLARDHELRHEEQGE